MHWYTLWMIEQERLREQRERALERLVAERGAREARDGAHGTAQERQHRPWFLRIPKLVFASHHE